MRAGTVLAAALACAVGAAVTVVLPATAAGGSPPIGSFTVEQHPPMVSGTGIWGHPVTTASITVDHLSDDVTPPHLLHVRLDVGTSGSTRVLGIAQTGADAGETQGVTGWKLTAQFGGTIRPVVTITDGDGNQTVTALPPISVVEDTTRPVMTLTAPAPGLRNTIRGWAVLRGTAVDPESPVTRVYAQVLQRRNGTWWAYDGTRRAWIRGNSSEYQTRRFLRPYLVSYPDAGKPWSLPPVRRLTKGLLVVDVYAEHGGSLRDGHAPQVRVAITRR